MALRRQASFHLGEAVSKRKLDHHSSLVPKPALEIGDKVLFRPGTSIKAYPGRIVKKFTYQGPNTVTGIISDVVMGLKNAM